MAEYITKEAAVDALDDVKDIASPNPITRYNAIYYAIEAVPAADVVEVCRCRDCHHSRPLNRNDWFESLYGDDCIWCTHLGNGMRKTDFCSDGERRSE